MTYTGIGASNTTPAAMSTAIKAALNQRPDALVVCNFFPPAENPLIRGAVEDGIPVFATNSVTDAIENGALAAFGQPDEVAGEKAGEAMAEAGVRNAVCVNDVPVNPSVVARCVGFERALEAKGIEVRTINLANAIGNTTVILNDIKGALRADSSIDGVLTMGPTAGSGGDPGRRAGGQDGRGRRWARSTCRPTS